MRKQRPCGNSDCSVSTGIHEGLTFGSGELDNNGYWEKPCKICAAGWEKKRENEKQERIAEFKSRNPSITEKDVQLFINDHEYLSIPAWPGPEYSSDWQGLRSIILKID